METEGTAAGAPSMLSSPTSAGKSKAAKVNELHLSMLDGEERDVARKWARRCIKERVGINLDLETIAVEPTASVPLEGSQSAISSLFRKILARTSSSNLRLDSSSSVNGGASSPPLASSLLSSSSKGNIALRQAPAGQGGLDGPQGRASSGSGGRPILGVPLVQLMERAPAVTGAHRLRLPAPMHEMVKYLRKPGRVDTDGIFRVSGAAKHIEELHQLFMQQPGLDLESVTLQSGVLTTHDVAALLKQFIRLLPEPLATANFERLCPNIQQLENGQDRLTVLQLFYISLPELNRDCFEVLIRFLHRVAREKNKMNATNLALVFTPALLTPAAQQDLQLHHHVVAVLKLIISRYEEIFKPTAWLTVREQVLRSSIDLEEDTAWESEAQPGPNDEGPAGGVRPANGGTQHVEAKGGANVGRSITSFFRAQRGLRRANTVSGVSHSPTAETAPAVPPVSSAASEPLVDKPLPEPVDKAPSATAAGAVTKEPEVAAALPARASSMTPRRRRRAVSSQGISTMARPVGGDDRSGSDTLDGLIGPTAAKMWSDDMLAVLSNLTEPSDVNAAPSQPTPKAKQPHKSEDGPRKAKMRTSKPDGTVLRRRKDKGDDTSKSTSPQVRSLEIAIGAGSHLNDGASQRSDRDRGSLSTAGGSGTSSPSSRTSQSSASKA